MKKGDGWKWLYTYVLFLATMGWAGFCVWTVKNAVEAPTATNVLEVAGVQLLLGALITWCADVKQFWFRKSPPTV